MAIKRFVKVGNQFVGIWNVAPVIQIYPTIPFRILWVSFVAQIDAAEKRAEKAEQEYKANVKFFEFKASLRGQMGLGYEVRNTSFVRLRRFQVLAVRTAGSLFFSWDFKGLLTTVTSIVPQVGLIRALFQTDQTLSPSWRSTTRVT